MTEHPDDHRPHRPIVPDPDASLSAPRPRHPAPPRVWPLWGLILLLVAAGGALAWAGWQERTRLQAELSRVSGELSNVHARFDAEEGRGEALEALRSRLDELSHLETEVDAVLDRRLAAFRSERDAELADDLEAARAQGLAPLEERLASLMEEAETRDATLAATRRSLDALERAGREGRAALGERLATLEQARERLAERRGALTEGMATLRGRLERLEDRLTTLDGQVEAAAGARDDIRQRMDALDGGLTEMGSGLRELRQTQVALSAQLEALRQ